MADDETTKLSAAMPEQPKTVNIPALTDRALLEDLTRVVKAHVTHVEERFDHADITLSAVVKEGQRTKVRLTNIEERVDAVEGRVGRTSSRVREGSEHDMSRDAKMADVIVWRNGVDTKLTALDTKITTAADAQTVAIVEGVKDAIASVAKSPMGKMIGYSLGALVLQALALATAYLALRGHP